MGYSSPPASGIYLPTTAAMTNRFIARPPRLKQEIPMSRKTSFIAAAIAFTALSLASLQPANAAVYVRSGAYYGPNAAVRHVGYTRVTPWGVRHVGYTRVWR
jgi:hypothetical protein